MKKSELEEQRRRLERLGAVPAVMVESQDLCLPREILEGFFGGRDPILARFFLDGSLVRDGQFFDDCGRDIPIIPEVTYRLRKSQGCFAVAMCVVERSWSEAVLFPVAL